MKKIEITSAGCLLALASSLSYADCFENCDSADTLFDENLIVELPIGDSKATIPQNSTDIANKISVIESKYGFQWPHKKAASCYDYRYPKEPNYKPSIKDGDYWIDPDGAGPVSHRLVQCDMTTSGGGWTIFQYRKDGSVSFDRSWQEYESGFGFAGTEYWLGNSYLYSMTNKIRQELRISLVDESDNKKIALYSEFSVANSDQQYALNLDGYIHSESTLPNSLQSHNRNRFSTHDKDWDYAAELNCAEEYQSGWWFQDCFLVNLNGIYKKNKDLDKYAKGIVWQSEWGMYEGIKSTTMMIRDNPIKAKEIPQRLAVSADENFTKLNK